MNVMRSISQSPAICSWVCAGVTVACLSVSAATPGATNAPVKAAGTNAAPVVVEVPIPKSVFVDQIKFGKDPFFPNTLRRNPKPPPPPKPEVPQSAPGQPPPPPPEPPKPPPLASHFTAKAIFGSKTKPLGVVNSTVKNYELFKGDSLSVKIPDFPNKENQKQIRIECLDITDDIIKIKATDGDKSETIELKLRKGP